MGCCAGVHVEYRPPPDFLENHSFFQSFTYCSSACIFKEAGVSSDVVIYISQSFMVTNAWNCISKSFVTQPFAIIQLFVVSINWHCLSVSGCRLYISVIHFSTHLLRIYAVSEQPCIFALTPIPLRLIAFKCVQESEGERGRDSDTLMGFIKVNLNTLTVWAWTSKLSLHSTANYSGHPSNTQAGESLNWLNWMTEMFVL